MKTTLLFILTCFSILSLESCFEKQQCNCSNAVIDVTDTFTGIGELNPALFVQNPKIGSPEFFNGIELRFDFISNLTNTKPYTFSLPMVTPLEGNEVFRQNEINQMIDSVRTVIRQIQFSKRTIDGSLVFASIANSLNSLVRNTKCNSRKLFILSDFRENSDFLNTYSPETLKRIVEQPESVMELLDKKYPLQDLNGVEIILLNHPSNKQDDAVLNFAISYYKKNGAIFK